MILTQELQFDKLRGRIVEKCGTLSVFAEKMGISKQMLSKKMTRKSGWSQSDIILACDILGIDVEQEVGQYFFKKRVQ